jgi:hypothetical protein
MLESTKIENIIIVLIVLPSVAYLLLVALLYLKIIKEKLKHINLKLILEDWE